MAQATQFIVMTSSAHVAAKRRQYGQYKNVAVVEVQAGCMPAMISDRAKGVIRIVEYWGGLSVGKTERSQYGAAMAEAKALAAKLNAAA